MPDSLVTIERRVPVKRLKSVDLPTLGRPTMTSDGRRSAMSSWAGPTVGAAACCAIFQCSAFRVAPEGKRWCGRRKVAAELTCSKFTGRETVQEEHLRANHLLDKNP